MSKTMFKKVIEDKWEDHSSVYDTIVMQGIERSLGNSDNGTLGLSSPMPKTSSEARYCWKMGGSLQCF